MKKTKIFGYALLPISITSASLLAFSCAKNDKQEDKSFFIESNLTETQGKFSNINSELEKDFVTEITILNSSEVDSVEIFRDNVNLIYQTDFVYEITDKNIINLKINASAIKSKNIYIKVIFKEFDVNFKSNDEEAKISTTKAKINKDFIATITIKEFNKLTNISIRSHSVLMVENKDFFVKNDGSTIHLVVFSSSIVDNDLNINIFTSRDYFFVNFISTGGSAQISNSQFLLGENFSTIITFNSEYDPTQGISTIFDSIKITSKTSREQYILVPGTDYKFSYDDTTIYLDIFWSNKISNNLSIELKLIETKNINDGAFDKVYTHLRGLKENADISSFKSIRIPPYIEKITENAFQDVFSYNNKKGEMIKSLYFSNNDKLKEIGPYAFSNCTSLDNTIKIPQSIEQIKHGAFMGCSNIQRLDFTEYNEMPKWLDKEPPEPVTNIFGGVSKWGYLFVNNKMKSILDWLKEKCSLPSTWIAINPIPEDELIIEETSKGVKLFGFNKDYVANDTPLLNLPDNIAQIEPNAFSFLSDKNNSAITNIYFNKTLKFIQDSAFEGLPFLSGGLTFNKDLLKIGPRAFKDCINVSEISFDILGDLGEIGDYAFCGDKKITGKLVLPKRLKTVGTSAFSFTNINELVIKSNLTQPETGAFCNLENLQTIDLSDFESAPAPSSSNDESWWLKDDNKIFLRTGDNAPYPHKVIVKKGTLEAWQIILTEKCSLGKGQLEPWEFVEVQ